MAIPELGDIDPRLLGERLQAARKARGLTQEEVAAHLNVARTTITAMESGDRRVKPGELVRLSGLYGRSIGELVQREEPLEPFSVQFRSTLAPDAYDEEELEPHIFEFQRLCEDYLALERLREAPLGPRYPPPYEVDSSRPEISAEDVANRERQRLGFGDAPILNLRSLLETDVGLRIFYMDLPSRVAAMFAYTQELGGCIAINRKHPAERRRLSLAHDFGHFLTDRYRPEVAVLGRYRRVPAHERFAEGFARMFLLPTTGLTRRFNELYRTKAGRITPADLCTLANFFFVSLVALTRRLEEMDLIPSGTWDRLEQRGFRVHEAQALLELPPRPITDRLLPTRYRYLAAEAFQQEQLSEGQLARFLRVDRVDARRMVSELARSTELSDEGQIASASFDLTAPI